MTLVAANMQNVPRPAWRRYVVVLSQSVVLSVALNETASAQGPVSVDFGSGESGSYARLLLLFAAVALAPAMLAVLTSFARIAIVLFFLRAGLGSNDIPPTVVIMGLAIFLTLFSMGGDDRECLWTGDSPFSGWRDGVTACCRSLFGAATRIYGRPSPPQ